MSAASITYSILRILFRLLAAACALSAIAGAVMIFIPSVSMYSGAFLGFGILGFALGRLFDWVFRKD